MADYFNQLNVIVNEIATLTFSHTVNNETREVARLVTPFDSLKNIHQFLGELIKNHEETLTKQKEANKKMI